MIILENTIWAGVQSAYAEAQAIVEKINARWFDDDHDDSGDERRSPNDVEPDYRVVGDTAVIEIKGPLLNRDLPFEIAQIFGVTTYPSLQQQFADATNDSRVRRVVLDVNSGGGSVSGLSETVELLANLKSQKQVETFVSGTMCSAAYWLGCVSDSITMSKMASAGSIGTIMTHYSYKGANEQDGIKATVLRSGEKKALGSSDEDLDDAAVAEFMKGLDFYTSEFKQHVMAQRNLNLQGLAQVSDGSVFYGSEAVSTGLADRIGTFESVLRQTMAQQGVGNSPYRADNGDPTMNLEEALAKVTELEANATAAQAALQTAEVRAAEAEAKTLEVEAANKALTAALAQAQSDNEAFASTLDANIKAKSNALRLEVLIPEDLAGKKAMNAQLEEKFQAKFPTGGVAAVAQPEPEAGTPEALPAWFKQVSR